MLNKFYNTILVKDIIRRKKIRNVPFLENLIRFMADNIGKQMSATSIQNRIRGHRFTAFAAQAPCARVP